MPIITVNMLSGRNRSQKANLVRALADAAVETLGVPLTSVRIILNEVPPEHWGIGSETKADQVEAAARTP
ncbi:MAG TPA: 2-hydroxymuconate tautomerase family protein [Sphingobium sp.]